MRSLIKTSYLLLLLLTPIFGQSHTFPFRISAETTEDHDLQIENLAIRQPVPLKVALVLSGGSARGFAHVGVLRAFEEKKIPLHLIVGTSIGAIVGGFYAVGYSADQIERRLKATDWTDIFANQATRSQQFVSQKNQPRKHIVQMRLNGFLPSIPSSLSQGQKIFQNLYNGFLKANFYGADHFDDLKIPFRAVATDLISGEQVILKDGDLAEAINASMAFPLLFAPVEIKGRQLVDGGITDNLPVGVAVQESADLIIAVDATSPLRREDAVIAPWEIADQVTSIMMSERTEASRRQADFLIRPRLNNLPGFNLDSIDSLIASGYHEGLRVADEVLKQYRQTWLSRLGDKIAWGTLVAVDCPVEQPGLTGTAALQWQDFVGRSPDSWELIAAIEASYASGGVSSVFCEIDSLDDGLHLRVQIELYPVIDKIRFRKAGFVSDSLRRSFASQVGWQKIEYRFP